MFLGTFVNAQLLTFTQETHYGFNGATYQWQANRYYVNYVDCDDSYCIVNNRMYLFDGEGTLNGARVRVYKIPLEAELILYENKQRVIINYNFVHGQYLNKLILK
jgi:hypothetical protein